MKISGKLFSLLLMITLLTALAACGGTTDQPGAGMGTSATQAAAEPTAVPAAAEATAAEATAAPATAEATEAPEATAPPEATEAPEATAAPGAAEATAAPAAAGGPVTIRYANWNVGTEEENNLQRRMVKAYTDAHPEVTVEFVDMSAEGGWEAVLTTYAARGELPDVFMANAVPLYVQNDWIADLTEFVKDDPDWADVPQVLKDNVTYDGKVLGLPAAQFVMGYFVNKDLFEDANLDAPEYGVSVDEFKEAVTSLHDVNQKVLGLSHFEPIMGWYANTQDPNLKWFSYDGEKMNYNSPAFKEAVVTAVEMEPYTWPGLTEEQIATFKSKGDWELFLNQEVGMHWEGGWAVPDYVANAEFEWDFIGIPGGNQALVSDVIVVSKTAPNQQAAYEFAKWMTFSKEAYATEVKLAKEMETAPKMPVSMDDESKQMYLDLFDKPGIEAALDNLDNSLVESLAKVVPGYVNARWEGKPGIAIGNEADVNVGYIFGNVHTGQYKFEDYSARLEEFANKILADAKAQIAQ
jgi:multiple sugar transport system substrate-binding protein